jgi:hypothetical protein
MKSEANTSLNKFSKKESLENYFLNYISQEAFTYHNMSEDYPERIYYDFLDLTQTEISFDDFQQLMKNSHIERSINPTLEIEDALKYIPEKTPKYAAGFFVKYNDVIVGSILAFVDPRTTLYGETAGFFIGIRKSSAMLAAQKYLPESILNNLKISPILLPAVEDYLLSHGAVYAVTSPLINMMKILEKHYGYKTTMNDLKNRYYPPVYVMIQPFEAITWKRLV